MGCIKNLAAVASSNLNVTLEDSAIRQTALRTPPEAAKGLVTRAARAAHAGFRAVAQAMASPAVYTCALPRKGQSRAAMVSVMTAHISCGRVSQAFLKILEPERKGRADSGVS
jgi:hypothetical protein